MAETEKEYLVGTVRPTNRPEAGQELDLDTLDTGKDQVFVFDDELHPRHRGRVQHLHAGL